MAAISSNDQVLTTSTDNEMSVDFSSPPPTLSLRPSDKYASMILDANVELKTSCQWYHALPEDEQIIRDDDGWRDTDVKFHKTLICEDEFKDRMDECSIYEGYINPMTSSTCAHCQNHIKN